jgi:hypothetical protein
MFFKIFSKIIMAFILVLFGSFVFAQCIPMNGEGPPRLWDGARGCYVPQGTPSVQYGQQSGQQIVYYGNNQQGFVNNGVPAQVFQPSGLPSGFNKCEVVGGIAGGLLGSLFKHHTGQATGLGAIAGGIAGDMYCGPQGQRILVQNGQQGIQNPDGQTTQVANNPARTTVPSDCDIDGVPELQNLKGLTEAQCRAIANNMTKHVAGRPVQSTQQATCSITRSSDRQTKVVPNPDRTEAYCDSIKDKLGNGTFTWENLPAVTASQ